MLAIAIIMADFSGLLIPVLFISLIAVFALMYSSELRSSLPNILAGLYLRIATKPGANLRSDFTNHQLTAIGWTTSSIRNRATDEITLMHNKDVLAAGVQNQGQSKQNISEVIEPEKP